MIFSFLLLIAALNAMTVWARYRSAPGRFRLFKMCTISAILLLALGGSGNMELRPFILAGLVFAMFGDFILTLDSRYFIGGLASFLVAYLCYLAAFIPHAFPLVLTLPVLLAMLSVAALLAVLLPHAGKLKIPVLLYGAAILAMTVAALSAWQNLHTPASAYAAVGAVLFVISDAALALNKFRRRFALAEGIILGTYFPAQLMFAFTLAP
jgi:uncharacterized membrane protein YhhN